MGHRLSLSFLVLPAVGIAEWVIGEEEERRVESQ